MDRVYFLALIVQLREMDMGVSEALGGEVIEQREKRTNRRKMYLPIHEEMKDRWEWGWAGCNCGRVHDTECPKLEDRDYRTVDCHGFPEMIHPGRCILPRGKKRRVGCDPAYPIYNIIDQKYDTPRIYLGGHRLLVLGERYRGRTSVKVSAGCGLFGRGLNHRIYDIMDELGFTDKERWYCSYGSDEKKLKQLKRLYNYLLEQDQ